MTAVVEVVRLPDGDMEELIFTCQGCGSEGTARGPADRLDDALALLQTLHPECAEAVDR